MTTIQRTTLPNGDIHETRSNPGCAPIVYINGIRQAPPGTPLNIPQWEKWFAWRPVRVKGHWTWLKNVYRRADVYKPNYTAFDNWFALEYGDIFDVLSSKPTNTEQRSPKPHPLLKRMPH